MMHLNILKRADGLWARLASIFYSLNADLNPEIRNMKERIRQFVRAAQLHITKCHNTTHDFVCSSMDKKGNSYLKNKRLKSIKSSLES